MTSQRKLKKRAEARGMTGPELQLVEMVDEMLREMRWIHILAYSNQYLLNQKLQVTQEERDQILEAATRAVDRDSKQHEWSARLDRLKSEFVNIKRKVDHAREDIAQRHVQERTEGAGADGEPPPAESADAAES